MSSAPAARAELRRPNSPNNLGAPAPDFTAGCRFHSCKSPNPSRIRDLPNQKPSCPAAAIFVLLLLPPLWVQDKIITAVVTVAGGAAGLWWHLWGCGRRYGALFCPVAQGPGGNGEEHHPPVLYLFAAACLHGGNRVWGRPFSWCQQEPPWPQPPCTDPAWGFTGAGASRTRQPTLTSQLSQLMALRALSKTT